MKYRKTNLFLLFFCIILFYKQSFPQTSATDTAIVPNQQSELNLIHPGDLLEVDIIGSTEYDWRGRLTPEGFLEGDFFNANPVYGLCQTEESVAEAVGKSYSKILRDPKVAVRILDRSNRPLALLYGAVKSPQKFQIKRPVKINELLVIAGGLTDKASGVIQIYRPPGASCRKAEIKNGEAVAGGENRERFVLASQDNGANYINIRIIDLLQGKEEANPLILSGDVITVQEAEVIYVIGGVANPKQIASRAQMTLSRAIDSAGGIIKGGNSKQITIFRREAGENKIIETDLDKIKSNQADDIILKPFDIVEVAQRSGGKSKFPPVLKTIETAKTNASSFPLKIID